MIYYILSYKSQMTLIELDFEVDKSWINAELTVMMAQL